MAVAKDALSRKQIVALTALTFAIFLIANDFTAFSVAIPAMQKHFHADISTMQWVINGYALVFGVLIVTGGRLADMFGRRRLFFIGTSIFILFSLLGGFAVNTWMLLGSRALMGVGGALMWPAILGMTYQIMPESRAGQAGGLIMTVCGFANSVGPLLGGFLTDFLSWRWIFFINFPIAFLAMLISWRVIDDDTPENADEQVDYAGITFLSVCLLALLLALDLVVDMGLGSSLIIGLFFVSVLAFCMFAWAEAHTERNPLIPADVATNWRFLTVGITTLLLSVIFVSMLLYVPQFLIKELKFSAVWSGAGLLPVMMTYGVVSYIAGRLYALLGAKVILSAAAIFLGGGMFLLSSLLEHTRYMHLVPGLISLGIGLGLFFPTITTAAVTAVGPGRASLAAALVFMFQIIGGAIGLAMNTTIVSLAPSLSAGIDRAFLVNAYLALLALLVSILFVRGERIVQKG
ncbi:MFS transporter [Microbulbifer sp. THAF38]|uniref:MFS transporter n=1 Tax=Microbulbifer sp. THAF38 TaxID=2587856 RepID=UPI001268536C|nr:MFS transporter [Microbulbifer sp. THAF38]QFT56219.1 Multidrug resistance protein stp [Microbulbifer sp. THAF38]